MTLKEKKARLLADAKALTELATTEARAMTDTESASFDAAVQEAEALTQTIARDEQMRSMEQEQTRSRGRATRDETRSGARGDDELRSWLLDPTSPSMEVRAQSFTASEGGYLVNDDQSLTGQIERAMKAFGGVRNAARVLKTGTGADLPFPTVDDTSSLASVYSPSGEVADDEDVAFGQVVFKAFSYGSGIVRIPVELVQDSAVPIVELVGDLLGERIARKTSVDFVTGGGSTAPQGVVTGSTLGKTTAAATAITYEEILDLIHSVDPAYRNGASFAFHDTTLRYLKGLKDDDGRPIWLPSLAASDPGTINGFPYIIDNSIATVAASAKVMLFGQFKKFVVRDAGPVVLTKLVERYAEFGEIALTARSRHDSRLLDAGTHPIKYLQMKSV